MVFFKTFDKINSIEKEISQERLKHREKIERNRNKRQKIQQEIESEKLKFEAKQKELEEEFSFIRNKWQ